MNPSPPPTIETEVKFHLSDPDRLRDRLLALGARSRGRRHEHNLRFDDPDGRLTRAHSLLRLRRDDACMLTFKAPVPGADPAFKQMTEIEVRVSDHARMQAILAALGFRPVQTYEKRRESFELGATVFCLDEMPFGHFLEIEAGPDAIRADAERLGLRWENRILLAYLGIFELLRRHYALPFTDLTFERFQGLSVDLGPLLPEIEAGPAR